MGRNKQIRMKFEGHRRMMREHEAKVKNELQSPNPREYLIACWQKRIGEAELNILHSEEQLYRH